MPQSAERLTQAQAAGLLQKLDGWKIVKGKLHKEFKFAGFPEAMDFITNIAAIAQSLNHHPEMFNVYSKVVLDLETHDVKGLSSLDFKFAERVDRIFRKPGS